MGFIKINLIKTKIIPLCKSHWSRILYFPAVNVDKSGEKF